MKKSLIALAVLGVAAGVAHAEPNVSVYGVVDTGYIKQNGSDLKMGENVNSRIGFKGAEDLGGGLRAIFQLEKRFTINDGTNNSVFGEDWSGAANVGLASADWGKVRFGRVNELSTETIRKFDPFYQYGIGGMLTSIQRLESIENTVRYDSPKWEGLSFGLSYSLGYDTENKDWYNAEGEYRGWVPGKEFANDGYAVNLFYENGPWMATANWSRIADSADSSVWNLGAAYKFADVRVMLSYEKTKNEGFINGGFIYLDESPISSNSSADMSKIFKCEQDSWLLGLEWDIGSGQLDASVQRMSYDDVKGGAFKDGNVMKYSVGYTYNLSKRTSLYGQATYIDSDKELTDWLINSESTTAVQVGMTHKF